jgi:hypothetical protein
MTSHPRTIAVRLILALALIARKDHQDRVAHLVQQCVEEIYHPLAPTSLSRAMKDNIEAPVLESRVIGMIAHSFALAICLPITPFTRDVEFERVSLDDMAKEKQNIEKFQVVLG